MYMYKRITIICFTNKEKRVREPGSTNVLWKSCHQKCFWIIFLSKLRFPNGNEIPKRIRQRNVSYYYVLFVRINFMCNF